MNPAPQDNPHDNPANSQDHLNPTDTPVKTLGLDTAKEEKMKTRISVTAVPDFGFVFLFRSHPGSYGPGANYGGDEHLPHRAPCYCGNDRGA